MAKNDKKSKAEYNSLVYKKNNAKNSYNAEKGKINERNEKIARLKRSKAIIKSQKDEFSRARNSDKKKINSKIKWKGNCYNSFNNTTNSLIYENNEYFNSLDRVLDSINTEIARLENQNLSSYGVLGELAKVINSLSHKIENFFN